MRNLVTICLACVILSIPVASCGDSNNPNTSGSHSISWTLNFGDYLSQADELVQQDCSNTIADWPSSPIATVHISLVDPYGQIPGREADFACVDGLAPQKIDIIGMTAQEYAVTAEGRDADGEAIYKLPTTTTTFGTQSATSELPLVSITGYIRFSLGFGNWTTVDCPTGEGIASVRTRLYKSLGSGTFEETPSFEQVDACADFWQLELIEVPAESSAPPALVKYQFVIEALDGSGTVRYCNNDEVRPIKPGVGNPSSNILLASGPCS